MYSALKTVSEPCTKATKHPTAINLLFLTPNS